MATRKIVEIGDEKLRKHCKTVEKFDLRLKILLRDMADTMYKNDGAGLAAPQVGILKRICVVDVGDQLYELKAAAKNGDSSAQKAGAEGRYSISKPKARTQRVGRAKPPTKRSK